MNIVIELIKNKGRLDFANPMDGFLFFFSAVTSVLILLLYLHQLVYLVVGTLHHTKVKPKGEVKQHKIGIVISARNESKVIGNLINSIRAQDYPQELIEIFVIADNCTDNTAQLCRDLGCTVVERFNDQQIGKGYALNYLFTKLHTEEEYAHLVPEAYIIVDADNILKSNYVTEMNKTFDCGHEMITSYRNSKNIGDNWLSAGMGYWFLHETRHLNNARFFFKTSCAISGTGFLISTPVVKEFDNWKFFSLIEDIQCSTEYALSRRKIAYCGTAELYDEQPTTMRQSWRQRERWSKGYYQVLRMKGLKLIKGSFTNFSCWDILTTIFPALFISLISLTVLPLCAIISLCLIPVDTSFVFSFLNAFLSLINSFTPMLTYVWLIGALLLITEWKKILAPPFKKIFYLFTFPFFMATYIPIAFVALFKKVKWEPIEHNADVSLEDLQEEARLQDLSAKEQMKIAHKKEEQKKNKRNSA